MSKLPLAAFLAILAMTGCHSTDHASSPCSTQQTKQDVLDLTGAFYLWRDELPTSVQIGDYATPTDLLNALTAVPRSEDKDRYFSYMTTMSSMTTYFEDAQNMGYGFGVTPRDTQLFICQVFPGSGADAAGFERGDEILAVSSTSAGLDDADSQAPVIIANSTLSAILDSTTQGTTRYFRVKRASDAATVVVTATTALYDLDPVPDAAAPVILDAGNGHITGYLLLRTFVEPAADLLRSTLATFKAEGVTDLIVDLRYDGGGRADVAEVFLNLLRATPASGDVMYQTRWNDLYASQDTSVLFSAEANALTPGRIAFIVTGSTASASELMVNALQPYFGTSLALVGSRTYGKPVAQVGYDRDSCDWLLMLISFQLLNADGTGSYFEGLPDANFTGISCAAEDDLAHAPGDPLEASTAAALAWISTGVNPGSAIPSASVAARRRTASALHPRPTLAQRHIPGTF